MEHVTNDDSNHEHHHQMEHMEHDHHQMMIADFRKRFYLTLVVTVPVMILSPMIQQWLGFNLSFKGSTYLLFALSSVVFFYGGLLFLKGFIDELKNKTIGMMTLIAVAIVVSYAYSIATVFGLHGMDFFWELCTLILIMLLGHWIEMKSIAGSSRELELLVKLMPAVAHKIHGEHIMDVKTDSFRACLNFIQQ